MPELALLAFKSSDTVTVRAVVLSPAQWGSPCENWQKRAWGAHWVCVKDPWSAVQGEGEGQGSCACVHPRSAVPCAHDLWL